MSKEAAGAGTGAGASGQREPESIGQLLALLGRQFAKSLPLRLLMAGIVFVAVWLVHTYLLVGPNGGFAPNDFPLFGGGFDLGAAVLGQTLALSGRVLGGSAFWFMLSLTISTLVAAVRQPGGGFLSRLGSVPSRVGASFGSRRVVALIAGAGWGCLLVGVIDNRFVALLLVIASIFALAGGDNDFSHIILRCTYNDGRKALSKPRRRLAEAGADAFLAGVCLAALVFALAVLLPAWLFLIAALGLLVVAAVVSQNPAAAATAAGALLVFLVFGVLRVAHADDGGWVEAGGTLVDWLTSQGAAQAAAMGLTPAMAASLGAIIGALGPALGAQFVAGIMPTLLSPPMGPGLGVQGGNGPAQCEGGLPNYWIDPSSCKLGITDTIARWRGLGPDVALTLAWAGPDSPGTGFGPGWSLLADGRVRTVADGALLATADGVSARFEPQPARPGEPTVAIGAEGASRLLGYAGAWVWEDAAAGLTRRFDALPDGTFGLTSVTDLNGLALSLQRDASGGLASIADAAGRRVTFDRDASGRVTGFAMPDGRAASFEYGAGGELARSTDLAGVTSEYAYDAAGSIVALAVGRDRKTTRFEWVTYPDGPGIASVTDASGGVTRYELLAPAPRTVRVTDAEGRPTTFVYDNGRLVEQTDALGVSIRYEYDAAGRVTAARGPSGADSTEYDAAGRILARTDRLGRRTAFRYDANGDVVGRTMPDGGEWQFFYDARRNPVGRISPSGRRSAMSWDERGLLVADTDADGRTTRLEYDGFGNVVAEIGPDGATRRCRYDPAGLHIVEVTDPAGSKTAFTYDRNDRLVSTHHPDGTEERSLFDCCTEVGRVDAAGDAVGVDRDPMMRPLRTTGGGSTSFTTYDRSGMPRTKGAGDTTLLWIELDAAGQPAKITRGDGAARELGYDTSGRLARQKSPSGYSISIERDPAGRPVRVTDSTGGVTEAGFDAFDRLTWARNARGGVVEVAYDADGLPLSKSSNGAAIATYEYSPGGALVAASTARGGVRYTLDAAGRVAGISYADGSAASFEHDARGQVAAQTLPGGLRVAYEYDVRGRMTAVAFADERIEWTYLPTGEVRGEKRSNGVSTSLTWASGLLAAVKHEKGRTAIYDVTWSFDALGRVMRATGTRPVAPAPLKVAPLSRDGAGRVASVGSAAVSYDADGNVIARAGAYEASFDAESRLVGLKADGAATTWAYDAFCRRCARTGSDGELTYLRDAAGRLIAESDGGGRVRAQHVWRGPVLVASVVDGAVRFYHTDRNANVVAVTDAAGNVIAAYDYDAFGAVTASTGEAAEQPFRFMGCAGVTAEAGGLYATGSRFYDPAMGQFLQKDPAGMDGQLEPWDYCDGDPVNLFDASGLTQAPYSGYLTGDYGGSTSNTYGVQYGQQTQDPRQGAVGQAPDGSGKVVSGVVNSGWGGYATYAAGSVLIDAAAGTVALTPAGWAIAGIALVAGISRLWAGGKSLREGYDGKNFKPDQNPLVETVDPGGVRTWPGKAWNGVCSMASGIKNGASSAYQGFKDLVGQAADPKTWIPGPGGYPGGGFSRGFPVSR